MGTLLGSSRVLSVYQDECFRGAYSCSGFLHAFFAGARGYIHL